MKNSTAIILVLISAGLFYTFLDPQYQKTKALRAEAGQYETVLENVENLSQTSYELMTTYREIPATDIERLNKILPDGIDAVKLATDLDAIASKYGIAIKNIQVVPSTNNDTAVIEDTSSAEYHKVALTFAFISDYQNFRRFLADIEESLRIIDVRSISFTAGESDFYEYRMAIETYWLK